ncbi:helix-turn-helix transcriptional regulator [Paenibacillus jiagnxiensis]|uniref:helix-turn-helix transcriptional regulator n=1 Tax=Paenibacillus jiagnxiensis TaxID=3228926 RepID=UPI0033B517B6
MAVMVAQRAIIKLYLLTFLEKNRGYGYQMFDELKSHIKESGLNPPDSEVYRILHGLVDDGVLYRTKQESGRVEFPQEIYIYDFTADGREKAALFKKQVKPEIERCIGVLRKAEKDNFL